MEIEARGIITTALAGVLTVAIAAAPSRGPVASVDSWTCAHVEDEEDGWIHFDGVDPGYVVTSPDGQHVLQGMGRCDGYPATNNGHTAVLHE